MYQEPTYSGGAISPAGPSRVRRFCVAEFVRIAARACPKGSRNSHEFRYHVAHPGALCNLVLVAFSPL